MACSWVKVEKAGRVAGWDWHCPRWMGWDAEAEEVDEEKRGRGRALSISSCSGVAPSSHSLTFSLSNFLMPRQFHVDPSEMKRIKVNKTTMIFTNLSRISTSCPCSKGSANRTHPS